MTPIDLIRESVKSAIAATLMENGIEPNEAEHVINDVALRDAMIRKTCQEMQADGDKIDWIFSVLGQQHNLSPKSIRHIVYYSGRAK